VRKEKMQDGVGLEIQMPDEERQVTEGAREETVTKLNFDIAVKGSEAGRAKQPSTNESRCRARDALFALAHEWRVGKWKS
jgi:hypothetical protein